MFLSYGLVISAILLVAGLWWCKEIIGRLPKDIEEFRTADNPADRIVILIFWALTVGVIFFIVQFIWGLIWNLMSGFL